MSRTPSYLEGSQQTQQAPRVERSPQSSSSAWSAPRVVKNVGTIVLQGGFGLVYLAVILPMYVMLKLVEIGPCDTNVLMGIILLVYVIVASLVHTRPTQDN